MVSPGLPSPLRARPRTYSRQHYRPGRPRSRGERQWNRMVAPLSSKRGPGRPVRNSFDSPRAARPLQRVPTTWQRRSLLQHRDDGAKGAVEVSGEDGGIAPQDLRRQDAGLLHSSTDPAPLHRLHGRLRRTSFPTAAGRRQPWRRPTRIKAGGPVLRPWPCGKPVLFQWPTGLAVGLGLKETAPPAPAGLTPLALGPPFPLPRDSALVQDGVYHADQGPVNRLFPGRSQGTPPSAPAP